MAGAIGLLVVVSLVGRGDSSTDTANETVVKRVKHDNRHDPWMKHVTKWHSDSDAWGSGSDITVETDYPSHRKSSWLAAYEICSAVKRAYAKGADELPDVTVSGIERHVSTRVDGSKHRRTKTVPLATSSKRHDFVCGILPPEDDREAARKLDIPVYLY